MLYFIYSVMNKNITYMSLLGIRDIVEIICIFHLDNN